MTIEEFIQQSNLGVDSVDPNTKCRFETDFLVEIKDLLKCDKKWNYNVIYLFLKIIILI
jgi:hypothetical protein